MDETWNSLTKTIRNYVQTCGGQISLPHLIEDLHILGADISYSKFGYTGVIDLLTHIAGLSVRYLDGECVIQTSKHYSSLSDIAGDDLEQSTIRINMKNDLMLQCPKQKRTVTVQPEKFTVRRNPVLRRYHSLVSAKIEENENEPDFSTEIRSSSHSSSNSLEFESSFDSSDLLDLSSYCDEPDDDVEPYFDFGKSEPPDFEECFADINRRVENLYGFGDTNGVYQTITRPSPTILKKELSNDELLERILNIINVHKDCVSNIDVESEYCILHGGKLPKGWLAVLETSAAVYIENLGSDILLYPNREFSRPPTLDDLPAMQLPKQKRWNIFITNVFSATSFWFRLLEHDYEDKYEILCHEMTKHYGNQRYEDLKNEVQSNELYVARVGNEYRRVVIIKVIYDMAECLDIDNGTTTKISLQHLYKLHEKFTNTPSMARQGSLSRLEKYEKCSYITCRLQSKLHNQKATALVDAETAEAVVWLTVFVENININGHILDLVEQKLKPPKLEVNQTYDVNVLWLQNNVARVQVSSPCFNLLQSSLSRAKEIIEFHENRRSLFAKTMLEVRLEHEVYLAPYKNGSWQRIIAKRFVSSSRAAVLFVDFGEMCEVEIVKIVTTSELPDTLCYIPPQALSVRVVQTNASVLECMINMYKSNLFAMKIVEKQPELKAQIYVKLPSEETATSMDLMPNLLHSINASKAW